MCVHVPTCTSARDGDRWSAHTIMTHPEQGWSLLCNGVILFDDGGMVLPDSSVAFVDTAPGPLQLTSAA